MRKKILLAVHCFISIFLFGQRRCDCNVELIYSIDTFKNEISIGRWGFPIDSQIEYETSAKRDYKLLVSDCKGKAIIDRCVDGKLFARYYFSNSLDTLKEYVHQVNPVTLEEKIIVYKYFEALEDGEREYFNSNGIIIKREKYVMGIRIYD
ncbi:MAG: hypothetical protein JNL95_12305 [Chitinophagales bacterium]|nr:hypothetical protein [Chitinophagales bacterium]